MIEANKEFEISFEDEKKLGSVIPEGDYFLKIKSAEIKKSNNGNDYLKWQFLIDSGDYHGLPLYDNTLLVKGKRWKLRQLLFAAGLPANEEKLKFKMSDVLEKTIKAYVVIKKDELGKYPDKNEIKKYDRLKVSTEKDAGTAIIDNDGNEILF